MGAFIWEILPPLSPFLRMTKYLIFVYGTRQGQITRFEIVLLASMGKGFLHNHPWRIIRGFASGWKIS